MDETEDVVTWNAAVFNPAATDRIGVTWTDGLSLETDSAAPVDGASPVSMTVAVDGEPPVTVKGARVRELGASGVPGGTTVRTVLCVCPLYIPVTFTVLIKPIGEVARLKDAVVAPFC